MYVYIYLCINIYIYIYMYIIYSLSLYLYLFIYIYIYLFIYIYTMIHGEDMGKPFSHGCAPWLKQQEMTIHPFIIMYPFVMICTYIIWLRIYMHLHLHIHICTWNQACRSFPADWRNGRRLFPSHSITNQNSNIIKLLNIDMDISPSDSCSDINPI